MDMLAENYYVKDKFLHRRSGFRRERRNYHFFRRHLWRGWSGAASFCGYCFGLGEFGSRRHLHGPFKLFIFSVNEKRLDHPSKHGLATAFAFSSAGILPLIPYFFNISPSTQFFVAIAATAISVFAVGASRTIVTGAHWFRSGMEMLLVGGFAALAAYSVGAAVKAYLG